MRRKVVERNENGVLVERYVLVGKGAPGGDGRQRLPIAVRNAFANVEIGHGGKIARPSNA